MLKKKGEAHQPHLGREPVNPSTSNPSVVHSSLFIPSIPSNPSRHVSIPYPTRLSHKPYRSIRNPPIFKAQPASPKPSIQKLISSSFHSQPPSTPARSLHSSPSLPFNPYHPPHLHPSSPLDPYTRSTAPSLPPPSKNPTPPSPTNSSMPAVPQKFPAITPVLIVGCKPISNGIYSSNALYIVGCIKWASAPSVAWPTGVA